MTTEQIKERLEYLRGELREERISYEELAELQDLAEHIDPGDVELLEAAGVPESETEGGVIKFDPPCHLCSECGKFSAADADFDAKESHHKHCSKHKD